MYIQKDINLVPPNAGASCHSSGVCTYNYITCEPFFGYYVCDIPNSLNAFSSEGFCDEYSLF